MLLIRLTKEDLNNLKVFLDRVDLKGKEVLPFVNILKAIQEAKKEDTEKVEPEKVGD